jgi:hypothetical protein
MTARVDEEGGPVSGVQIPMQTRRFVDLAQVAVLADETSELRVKKARFRKVEPGLGVEDVTGEREAVGGGRELVGESEVAPGILGN